MFDDEQRNDIDILPVYLVGWVCYPIHPCWMPYFALGWTDEETKETAMYRLIGWKQQLVILEELNSWTFLKEWVKTSFLGRVSHPILHNF